MDKKTLKNSIGKKYLYYIPNGIPYKIVAITLIKNDDGSWDDGVIYQSVSGMMFVRKLTQLNKFSLDDSVKIKAV